MDYFLKMKILKIDIINQYKYKESFKIFQGTFIINKNEKIEINEIFDKNLVYLNLIYCDINFNLVDKNNDLINNNKEVFLLD